MAGLAQLLPPELARRLDGAHTMWTSMWKFLASPEKLLLVLVLVFAGVLFWESRSSTMTYVSFPPSLGTMTATM
jgi:hypothetical protein